MPEPVVVEMPKLEVPTTPAASTSEDGAHRYTPVDAPAATPPTTDITEHDPNVDVPVVLTPTAENVVNVEAPATIPSGDKTCNCGTGMFCNNDIGPN